MQLHNATWVERVSASLTSPQYAVLLALTQHEDFDQRSVSEWVALDKSTGGDVIGRLVGRGLIRRRRDEQDRRRNLLELTPVGRRTLDELTPKVIDFSRYLVDRLTAEERTTLNQLLTKLVF
jgi:DNA-binding MarR family transcriptional regulator